MAEFWRIAFPMYVLPEMQDDMRTLWTLLRTRLALAGVRDLPAEPEFADPLVGGVPDNLLMLQYCGFPYVTEWREQLRPFACLHYDAPHCAGTMHRSVIVVRKDYTAESLADMRGSRVAINGYDSNTGMNLLRHAVAPLTEGKPFFAEVRETGAHVESLRAVVSGEADIAAIDCVTFAFIGDYLPEFTQAVRVLDVTAESPALPLFVPATLPQAMQDALYHAWQDIFTQREQAAQLLARLRMKAISPVDDAALQCIADYAAEAAAQGYPELV